MDLVMPGMDGFETIQRIRRKGVKTPIIIVSSVISGEDRRRCLEVGGDEFLPKPITRKDVSDIIDKYEKTKINTRPGDGKNEKTALPRIDFSHYHVLLVEEGEIFASPILEQLKKAGFQVTRVKNGNQAWELFKNKPHSFDIVITNMFISDIDGFGILDRIKREDGRVLVYIYAEEIDPESYQLGVQLGADGMFRLADFGEEIPETIESALINADQAGSRKQNMSTASQVRKAQAQLIQYGCDSPCRMIDIGYIPFRDAGGDMACCRRFNKFGRCGIFLGDVSGHDVTSSYISAISLGMLTSNWGANQQPIKIFKKLNNELNRGEYSNYHLCATAMLWEGPRKKAGITTAGNPGTLALIRTDKGFRYKKLQGGGLCLGMLPKEDLFINNTMMLNEGDYLFFHSDGVNENDLSDVLNSGEFFPGQIPVSGLGQKILERLLEIRKQEDDMILIVFCCPEQIKSPDTVHYELNASFEAVDRACDRADRFCTPDKIPSGHDPYLVILALREALLNAVIHGNRLDADTFVDLHISFSPEKLKMYVSDEGAGFELPDKIKKIEDINILQCGGRGLCVIASIADHMEVDGATITLVFEKK